MGEIIRGGCGRTKMVRQSPVSDTTETQRQQFLGALAASCNVRRAAAEAGFNPSTAYKLRQRDAGFAEAWQAALESGYARLEMALVERAIEVVEGVRAAEAIGAPAGPHDGGNDAVPVAGAMTVAQAIDVMNKHRASVGGGRAKRVRLNARNRPTAEETDAEILRRIAVIERQRAGRTAKGER